MTHQMVTTCNCIGHNGPAAMRREHRSWAGRMPHRCMLGGVVSYSGIKATGTWQTSQNATTIGATCASGVGGQWHQTLSINRHGPYSARSFLMAEVSVIWNGRWMTVDHLAQPMTRLPIPPNGLQLAAAPFVAASFAFGPAHCCKVMACCQWTSGTQNPAGCSHFDFNVKHQH